ncbi:MAG: hypothetical protein DMG97_07205 [Acidobacteria bacterium]|nr:MAG: hypothetical protein DMG97_07205 [Acidobacteriota bacterium]
MKLEAPTHLIPLNRVAGTNNARIDFAGCFGGYKQSGNGREWVRPVWKNSLSWKLFFGYGA